MYQSKVRSSNGNSVALHLDSFLNSKLEKISLFDQEGKLVKSLVVLDESTDFADMVSIGENRVAIGINFLKTTGLYEEGLSWTYYATSEIKIFDTRKGELINTITQGPNLANPSGKLKRYYIVNMLLVGNGKLAVANEQRSRDKVNYPENNSLCIYDIETFSLLHEEVKISAAVVGPMAMLDNRTLVVASYRHSSDIVLFDVINFRTLNRFICSEGASELVILQKKRLQKKYIVTANFKEKGQISVYSVYDVQVKLIRRFSPHMSVRSMVKLSNSLIAVASNDKNKKNCVKIFNPLEVSRQARLVEEFHLPEGVGFCYSNDLRDCTHTGLILKDREGRPCNYRMSQALRSKIRALLSKSKLAPYSLRPLIVSPNVADPTQLKSLCKLIRALPHYKNHRGVDVLEQKSSIAEQHEQIHTALNEMDLSQGELDTINHCLLRAKNFKIIRADGKCMLVSKATAYEKKEYEQRFQEFLKASNDKEAEMEALRPLLKQIVTFRADQPLRMIDVGCGNADLSLRIVKSIKTRDPNIVIDYVGVDKDSESVKLAQQRLEPMLPGHCRIYAGDFRKLPEFKALVGSSQLVLCSHLYTSTKMSEFLEWHVYPLLEINAGVALMVHNTPESDPVTFRAKLPDLLQAGTNTSNPPNDILEATRNTKVYQYHYFSETTFPEITEAHWDYLMNRIQQSNYDAHYPADIFSIKGLIEFTISDRLESFSDSERKKILIEFRGFLAEKNNILKQTCMVQAFQHPKCESQLIRQIEQRLHEGVELGNAVRVPSGPVTMWTEPIATTDTSQEQDRTHKLDYPVINEQGIRK